MKEIDFHTLVGGCGDGCPCPLQRPRAAAGASQHELGSPPARRQPARRAAVAAAAARAAVPSVRTSPRSTPRVQLPAATSVSEDGSFSHYETGLLERGQAMPAVLYAAERQSGAGPDSAWRTVTAAAQCDSTDSGGLTHSSATYVATNQKGRDGHAGGIGGTAHAEGWAVRKLAESAPGLRALFYDDAPPVVGTLWVDTSTLPCKKCYWCYTWVYNTWVCNNKGERGVAQFPDTRMVASETSGL
jgi:hypothetical protein